MPDDELNPTESTQADQAEDSNRPGDELEQAKATIAELENLLATKGEEITTKDNRVSELELTVSNLQQSIAESNDNLAELKESLNQATGSYRALVVQANPEVLEELVTGDSIEAVDESLKSAKELIGKVKTSIAAEIASAKVPAEAPQRTPPDLSALSSREKIHYALGR